MLQVLVDGNSLGHICWHALPLTTKEGSFDLALGLWLRTFFLKLNKALPERGKVFIFWDSKQSVRKKLLDSYKAGRGHQKHAVSYQNLVNVARELFTVSNLPTFSLSIEGLEADDLIATFSHFSQEPALIVSADKDLMQLISNNVSMVRLSPKKVETVLSPIDFQARFGFPPKLLWVYLSLVGDSSDRIKGVRGYGPAKFAKELKALGIEGILEKWQDNEQFKQSAKLTKLPNFEFWQEVNQDPQEWFNSVSSLPGPYCQNLEILFKALNINARVDKVCLTA